MKLPLVEMQAAVRRGVSLMCASCSHYARARQAHVEGDGCFGPHDCGGPFSGHDFHGYDGPITDTKRWCFVCGEAPARAIRVIGSEKRFGICERHLDFAYRLAPKDSDRPDLLIFQPGEGERKAVVGAHRQTVGEALLEIEKLDGDWEKRHA